MNSSIQAIGPSQSVKPSFGMVNIQCVWSKYHPMNVLGRENGEKFIKRMNTFDNIDLIISDSGIRMVRRRPEVNIRTEKPEIVEGAYNLLHIPERPEQIHNVDMDYRVFNHYGRNFMRFEDGSFKLTSSYNKHQVKYGYEPLQRLYVAIENAAAQLNDPIQEFKLINLFSKFSK